MFTEPLIFAVTLTARLFMTAIRLIFKFIKICVKYGFGWLLAGYFIEYYVYSGQKGSEFIICMFIAWGGTLLHVGIKIARNIKRKKNSVQEESHENI